MKLLKFAIGNASKYNREVFLAHFRPSPTFFLVFIPHTSLPTANKLISLVSKGPFRIYSWNRPRR